MKKKRWISHAEEIQINYVDVPQEGNISPSPYMWTVHGSFFPKRAWQGVVRFSAQKLDKHDFGQVIKVSINSDQSHC